MKKYNLEKLFMIIKRNLKNKVKITKSTVLAFLMVGSIGVAQIAIEGKNQSVVISNDEQTDKDKYKHDVKNTVVIGNKIVAKSDNNGGTEKSDLITTSVIIGSELTTNSNTAVNIGYKNTTDNLSNVVIGDNLESKGQYTIVIGSMSLAKDSSQVDSDLKKDDKYQIMRHYTKNEINTSNNLSNNDSSIIIGRESNTYNQGTVSIGRRTSTYGEKSIAIGDDAKSYSSRSISFGSNAKTLGQQAYALGYQSLVYDVNGIAFGTGATSAKEQAIAIGNLSMVNGKNSIAIGTKANVGSTVSFLGLNKSPKLLEVKNSLAIGNDSSVIEHNSTAIGYGAKASGKSSIAIGNVMDDNIDGRTIRTEAKGDKSISLGTMSQTEGNMSLSIGYNTKSKEESSVTVGQNLENKSEHSVLIGDTAKNETASVNSIAIGYKAEVALKDAVAIGSESEAKTEGTKVEGATVNRWNYGKHNSSGTAFAGALTEKNRIVSFGKEGKERQLKFVASGQIDKSSTDAINGSQLYLTNMTVSKLGDSLVNIIDPDIVEVAKDGDDLGTLKLKANNKGIGDTGEDTIHKAIKYINDKVSTPKVSTPVESKLSYKAEGNADTKQQVEISDGLDFYGDKNIKALVEGGGKVKYELSKELKDIKSIASNGDINLIKFGDNIELKNGNTTIKVTDEGLDLGNKKLTNVLPGSLDLDGVNYSQIKNFIKKDDLKPVTFKGDTGESKVKLGDGFNIKGSEQGDITVKIDEKTGARISLNKENVIENGTKTVSSGNIYNAIKNSKTKVDSDKDSYINVVPKEGEGINANVYSLALNKVKLKDDLQKELYITYKANGKNNQKTLLSKGLDFYGDTNILTSVGADGRVNVNLNKNLADIESIQKNENSKISFGDNSISIKGGNSTITLNDEGLDLNSKKLLNVAAGEKDTDGVNYGQIKNLADNTLSNLGNIDINAKNKLNELVVVKGDSVTTTVENTVENGIKTYTVKAKLDDYAKKDQIKPITFVGNSGKNEVSLGDTFNIKGDDVAGDITVKVEEDGAKLSLNKIGEVKENEEKVVSSKGIYKAIKDSKTKVSQKEGEQYITVEKTESEDIKANNYTLSMNFEKLKEDLNNQLMLSYKAGGNNKKTISLNEGLDFHGDENIATSVDEKGKVNINLNKALTGIESIQKDINSKIEFGDNKVSITGGNSTISLDDKGLDLGNKKITKVEAGTEETDAVNFGQLKEVESKLSKQGDRTLTFEADNSNSTGSKFVRKNSENATLKISSGDINGDYLGKNLKTSIDKGGNLKIGFSKTPEFEGLKLKNGDKSIDLKVDSEGKFTANGKEVITAGNTNKYFKAEGSGFIVSTDDNGVVTYKIEKSTGIKDNLDDYKGENTERLVTDKQVTEFVKKKVDAINDDVNNKITNLDIKYTANSGDKKSVKLTEGFDFTNGKNTTAEVSDKGVVKFNVNKDLTEMTSFETSKAENGNSSKLNAEGLTIKNGEDANPAKQATYSLDKTVIKDGNKSVEIKPDSITFGNKKGVITGLKDIPNDYNDGSVAVNKNYVDEKVLKFKGDEGEVITRKLDSQLNILGDGNISVKSGNDDTLNVTLSKDIKGINSIELGKVNISTKGLDNGGNRITNVAEGVNPTDAVNVSQLGKASDRGIAVATTSIAMANIPQVGDNKLFSIGAGLGYSGKQGAFAVGVSGTERTNTFIYKLSAGIDTQKQFSVGAGFNMNFGDNRIKLKDAEIAKLKDKNKKLEDRLDNMEKEIANMKQNDFREKLYVIDQFINDEYIPTEMQVKKLKAIVKEINEKYSDRIIDISGHTDTNYYERYNLDLGLRRANKVYEMLIELGLENPQNIRKVSSYGYNNKVNSKDGVGILSSNRRVEIYIK